LQEALAALPEPERTVFKLRVLGRTYQEIADQTGLPRGTVGRVIKEVREEIEKEIGLQLTLDVSDVTQGTTKTLVGVEAQNQLLKDLLSLATPAEKKQLFDATRESIQEAAKKKIENAFVRLGTSYEEFSGMSKDRQARILGQLGTQGVTNKDGAHASGNIQESEVMAQLRNAVIDAVRRGKRGRPPRKNDGGISALIYQLLGRLSWAWV
jgi:transcriptional regulator